MSTYEWSVTDPEFGALASGEAETADAAKSEVRRWIAAALLFDPDRLEGKVEHVTRTVILWP